MRLLVVIASLLVSCAAPVASTPSSTLGSASSGSASPTPTVSPSAGASAPLPPTVSTLPTPDPNATGPSAETVRFADARHGWLGTADGILGTSDGGSTWTQELSSERVHRIWALDATHAWALLGNDAIFRTADGTSWQRMPPTTPPIIDLDFVSPSTGWAIAATNSTLPGGGTGSPSTATLLRTDDGGTVWRRATATPLYSVCFSSERQGLGAFGTTIYRTADGGRTWIVQTTLRIPDRGPWYPQLICAGAEDARVQITEPYAALGHAPYVVFATTDGGTSWRQEFVEGYTLGSVLGPAPGLGSYPSLFGVLPDHTTWAVTCSPPSDTQSFIILAPSGAELGRRSVPFAGCARSASFVDGGRGWAVATSYRLVGNDLRSTPVVVRTTDGARGWTLVYPK